MVELLKLVVLKLIRSTIADQTKETPRGREGTIGKAVALPVLVFLGIFFLVGYLAVWSREPDAVRITSQQEQISAFILLLLPAGAVLLLIHLLTFKVWVSGDTIHTSSLVTKSRTISLDQPFGFQHDEGNDSFKISQNGVVIRLAWTLNGYQELLELVRRRSDSR